MTRLRSFVAFRTVLVTERSFTRTDWAAVQEADRRGGIDTPSWLWESMVSLAGSHEAGDLDHCRRYAL
jgi:hypothetical protein